MEMQNRGGILDITMCEDKMTPFLNGLGRGKQSKGHGEEEKKS